MAKKSSKSKSKSKSKSSKDKKDKSSKDKPESKSKSSKPESTPAPTPTPKDVSNLADSSLPLSHHSAHEQPPRPPSQQHSQHGGSQLHAPGRTSQQQQQRTPCENCNSSQASSYCPECELLLCPTCDASIHSAPAFASHPRRPLWEAALHRRPCRYHPSKRLKYFCTTCGVPACPDCRLSGPHAGGGHTVVPIREAFSARVRTLAQRVHGPLRSKRDELSSAIARVEGAIGRIRNHCGEIERATRLDFEGVLARLRRSEGLKVAVCQQDLDLLRADLLSIEEMERQVNSITLSHRPDPASRLSEALDAVPQMWGPFELLEQLPSLHARIDGLLARAADTQASQAQGSDLSDLPTEVRERATAVSDLRGATRLLRIKEELVTLSERERDEAVEQAREELDRWCQLGGQYADQLKRVAMRCAFCGCGCEPSSVNSACSGNPDDVQPGSYLAARRMEPLLTAVPSLDSREAVQYVGNGRHYFISGAVDGE